MGSSEHNDFRKKESQSLNRTKRIRGEGGRAHVGRCREVWRETERAREGTQGAETNMEKAVRCDTEWGRVSVHTGRP